MQSSLKPLQEQSGRGEYRCNVCGAGCIVYLVSVIFGRIMNIHELCWVFACECTRASVLCWNIHAQLIHHEAKTCPPAHRVRMVPCVSQSVAAIRFMCDETFSDDFITHADGRRAGSPPFFVFPRTISRKTMQLGSPNSTYKCSSMSPRNPCILGSNSHRSRSRLTQPMPACVFALLWVLAFSSYKFTAES